MLAFKKPDMSFAFWFSFTFVYLGGFIAIVALVSPGIVEFFSTKENHVFAGIKIIYVRLPLLITLLTVFPILLFKSVTKALWFMRYATAIAVFFYIDDHLVLYEIIGFPERATVKLAIFLRPIIIMAMLWMTFELHFKAKVGNTQ
jgi:hypothetical protein